MTKNNKLACAVLLLAVVTPAAHSQVKLPESISAKAGRIVVIKADTKVAKVVWWCLEARQGAADLLPLSDASVAFASPQPGRFLVLAFVDGATAPAEVWVLVEQGPGPPPPIDPLIATLRTAYQADVAAGKGLPEKLRELKTIFDLAPDFIVDDRSIGDVQTRLRNAVKKFVPAGTMPNLAGAVASYLATELPKDAATPLTAELRTRCERVFRQLAAALGKLP